jgi:hypothetical protein
MEKRIYKRNQLICFTNVHDRSTGSQIGHLINISPEGLMLMSEKPLEIDRPYSLSIQLTNPPGPLEFLSVETICRWCKIEQHASFYDAGFEFLHLDENDRHMIVTIISTMCFKAV